MEFHGARIVSPTLSVYGRFWVFISNTRFVQTPPKRRASRSGPISVEFQSNSSRIPVEFQSGLSHSKNSPCDNWEWWQAACVRRNFKFDYNALVAVSKLELWKKTYKIFCSPNDEKRDLLRTLNKTVERTNTILDNAFDGCNKFNISRLPQSTLKIGKFAFRGCTGLTMTKLPPFLKFIGSRAFFQCTNMDLVAIPEELVAIDISAFEQASQATQARWEKYSENYTYEYGNFLVVSSQALALLSSTTVLKLLCYH